MLVSPQLTGVELVVGAFQDPWFGPVVMVGLGGVWVEVLADVAFALAPVTFAEAGDLLAGLKGFPLLRGARGSDPVDLDAVARVVVSAATAIAALPGVASIDLNPVLAAGTDAVAVDWKISL